MKSKKASAPKTTAKAVTKPPTPGTRIPKNSSAPKAKPLPKRPVVRPAIPAKKAPPSGKPSATKAKRPAVPPPKPSRAGSGAAPATKSEGKSTTVAPKVVPPSASRSTALPPKSSGPAAAAKPTASRGSSSRKVPWVEISAKTPRQAHFRMPAEWETHFGTWLTWPNKKGISFPGKGAYDAVVPAFESMLRALIASEDVFMNVASDDDKQAIRDALTIAEQRRVHFVDTPAMEPWCRDHGATFVVRDQDRGGGSVLWKFNAWGGKYDKAGTDSLISRRMADYIGGKIFEPGIVLEGGAIEVNGSGTVLTTESCLLNKNRNRGMKREDMERLLKDFLGVSTVLWLPEGLEGDDTDGHIDTLARFINKNTVLACVEDNAKDKNHAILSRNLELLKGMKIEDGTPLQVLPLPMPQPIVRKGQRLPATYANFYIGNKVVLMPTYDDPADEKALEVMVKSFPTRRIYPIDCRELIWGLGAFHCLTQQLPLAAFPKVVDLIRNPPPAPRPVY